MTQFAKLAAGEQLCRRCTHRKNYSPLKPLNVFLLKNHKFLSCDSVVGNVERYVPPGLTFTNSTFCPTQLYLCVLRGSQNKQRLFPYTALTDWFV